MTDKKEELIKTYRNQISLKSDIIKGKNDELKKLKDQYNKELNELKNNYEIKINKIIEEHQKEIEQLKNTYNELVYISERKCVKLMKSQKSYLWG